MTGWTRSLSDAGHHVSPRYAEPRPSLDENRPRALLPLHVLVRSRC
jgi:hypothetical protein